MFYDFVMYSVFLPLHLQSNEKCEPERMREQASACVRKGVESIMDLIGHSKRIVCTGDRNTSISKVYKHSII